MINNESSNFKFKTKIKWQKCCKECETILTKEQISWIHVVPIIVIVYVLWPVTHVFIHLAVKIYSIIILFLVGMVW